MTGANVRRAAAIAVAAAICAPAVAQDGGSRALSREGGYPAPAMPFAALSEPEAAATETLADAIERAYRTNPTLGSQRYELRATDEALGQALAELRPTASIQVSGGYDRTDPGRATESTRALLDRLRSADIIRNDAGAQLIVDQPVLTGGRASADIDAARAAIRAGREALRGGEGDLIVGVIGAYVDVRRDAKSVAIRRANVSVLDGILAEVAARREAGELTRTDIAQAETQLAAARVLLSTAEGQLEASRASYAALTGANPGVLAPEPALPLLPRSIDEAFATAGRFNPDLAQAIDVERASRARIAAAQAEANPTLTLRGTAGVTGQASPLHLYNEDAAFSGRAVLTIPLSQGGRVGSLTAEAAHRNSADRLRIEAARRQMIQNILAAWNQLVVGQRNIAAQEVQLDAARVYAEGTYEEYRNGLRSTFDVLFAQNSVRDTEIGLLATRRDLYFAQALLLRQIGQLEVGKLLTSTGLYDPATGVRHIERRGALPWDPAVRALDRAVTPGNLQETIAQPPRVPEPPRVAPGAGPAENPPLATHSPVVPIPGTTGRPSRPRIK